MQLSASCRASFAARALSRSAKSQDSSPVVAQDGQVLTVRGPLEGVGLLRLAAAEASSACPVKESSYWPAAQNDVGPGIHKHDHGWVIMLAVKLRRTPAARLSRREPTR